MWDSLPLGEVCELIGGGTPSKKNSAYYGGPIPWATVRDMHSETLSETELRITDSGLKNSSTKVIPANNVVIASRVGLGKVCLLKQDTAINQDLRGVIPKKTNTIDVRFLFYWFKSISQKIIDAGRGATVHGVTLPFLKALEIPLPPLSEQHRIVAKLDAAFAEIDTAIEATDIQRSAIPLVFAQYLSKISASAKALEGLVDIKTGKLNANAMEENGKYPFFTCSRDSYRINTYAFDCDAVLLAGNNAAGEFNVKHYDGKFNAYQRTYVLTVRDETKLRSRYLYYQLINALQKFKAMSVGSGTRFLKLGMIKEMEIPLPSLQQQDYILEKLELLQSGTSEYAKILRTKLCDLRALKVAMLAQELQSTRNEVN